ncbi:hypothetical protein A5887_001461, partial [Enterococcus faecium]
FFLFFISWERPSFPVFSQKSKAWNF